MSSQTLLINYADKAYYKAQKDCLESGLKFGFTKVIPYSFKDLDDEFITKNRLILSQSRGAGYWIWKPYIILKTLKEMNEGDILFYADSGSTFIRDITPLLKLTDSQDIICFELTGHLEKTWTKKDLFLAMNMDKKDYSHTSQRLASFQIVKKSDFSVRFYEEYLALCENPQLVTDLPNIMGKDNYDTFREARHDQSIFSLLTKKYLLKCFRDPSQFGNEVKDHFINSPYEQIIFHHRNRN